MQPFKYFLPILSVYLLIGLVIGFLVMYVIYGRKNGYEEFQRGIWHDPDLTFDEKEECAEFFENKGAVLLYTTLYWPLFIPVLINERSD